LLVEIRIAIQGFSLHLSVALLGCSIYGTPGVVQLATLESTDLNFDNVHVVLILKAHSIRVTETKRPPPRFQRISWSSPK
jgi:hypothetical protein